MDKIQTKISIDLNLIEQAILIRRLEETFLELFSQGKLRGPLHTCVGQEFSGIAFAGQIEKDDFVFSNHRGHGHFIAYTNDYYGLISELLSKESGTCGGIGGTQHLCQGKFFSNGVQGGIVPVAAGLALSCKLRNQNNIGLVFIGDGTLGEGAVYETMNIVSKWEVPLLIVCENNSYAQSTHKSVNLAGDIIKRADAFDIKTFENNTWDVESLMKKAKEAINFVRKNSKPAFFLVETFRLNSHSKGDDHRDKTEVERYKKIDPLNIFIKENPKQYQELLDKVNIKIKDALKDIEEKPNLSIDNYLKEEQKKKSIKWEPMALIDARQVELINQFFIETMNKDKNVVFIGEDVLSPYGGAFKVAKKLSDRFPNQVFSTPISEAAIAGISNGLAMAGMRPFLEIMFGDFITLTIDQIVNYASKVYHMFNKQVTCPIVIRTPMGGRRGYGPTHSQSLEKILVGIDNVKVIALNNFSDPRKIYNSIYQNEKHPVIVIENKTDYGKKIGNVGIKNYKFEQTNEDYPVIRIKPESSTPNATIVTYGGASHIVLDAIDELFMELEIKAEVIILSTIHPIGYDVIIQSVKDTGKLFVVEEGSYFTGLGSEIISSVIEKLDEKIITKRIAALPVPIPCVKSLEDKVLPSVNSIIEAVKGSL